MAFFPSMTCLLLCVLRCSDHPNHFTSFSKAESSFGTSTWYCFWTSTSLNHFQSNSSILHFIRCSLAYWTPSLPQDSVECRSQLFRSNDTWISGVSRPDQSVFQSGGVQVCLCTRCNVGILWSWQFRCCKWKMYNFHTISVIFVEILLANCQFEKSSPFHLVLTSTEVGTQYSRNRPNTCCPPWISPLYSQPTLRFGMHILNNITSPAKS